LAYRASVKIESHYRISPLSDAFVARVRRAMVDDFGHQLQVTTSAARAPCRFTLEMAAPGEELILLSYSPFAKDHPYREIGPIFIRRHGAAGYSDVHRFPPQIDPMKRVFRCYDAAEQIVDARVGTAEPETLIAALFTNPLVDCIHARALPSGCFNFKIERA
jgi:hypothetical protein